MSKTPFIHKKRFVEIKDGNKVLHEEEIIDDGKELKFKMFEKTDSKTLKYFGKLRDDGTWIFIHTSGDKKEEKEMSHADLVKAIKKVKSLDFASDYLSKRAMSRMARMMSRSTNGRKTFKSKRRASKKASRKGSRKRASKKASRKRASRKRVSRKGSKKRVSRKRSRKQSRSKKGSKKRVSKKRVSKKGSKKRVSRKGSRKRASRKHASRKRASRKRASRKR